MATPVLMPKLDMTMTEGILRQWHKQEGDRVQSGEALFEVEADKLTMDQDAPADGTLRGVAHAAGALLPIGTVLGYIVADGEAWSPAPAPSQAAPAAGERVRATPAARHLARLHGVDLRALQGSGPDGRIQAQDVVQPVRITPVAGKMAAELGIDPRQVTGSGVRGKVMKADIAQAAAQAAAQGHTPQAQTAQPAAGSAAAPQPAASTQPTAGAPRRLPLSGIRSVIARRMSESWQNPHVTLTLEADCSELVRIRTRLSERAGVKVSYNTLLSFLSVKALLASPVVNATWDGPDLLQHQPVHLGVAVDGPNGLIVPVVHEAHTMGLTTLSQRIADLAERARSGKLTPGELSGATFTLSNLGSFGIEAFTPIINPPQVAILGVGAIIEKVVPVDGQPAIRPRMTLSLSFDHRAMDGADGARFLAHLRSLIETPERVLL